MEKINVAELLKNCAKGMELDCAMYDGLVFVAVDLEMKDYPIKTQLEDGTFKWFTFDGKYELYSNAKCVIFPKGKTTWEGFVPPCKFKDGDIIYVKDKYEQDWCSIIKNCKDGKLYTYVDICIDSNSIYSDKLNILCYCKDMIEYRLATKKEKEKLFNVIKTNNYKWNAETKTLEKFINRNKFVVGAIITNGKITSKIISKDFDSYRLENGTYVFFNTVHNWELAPSKFDISTLKPFDKVLVRGDVGQKWTHDLFGFMDKDKGYPFVCVGHYVNQCVPYENNEHLLGNTYDCDDFYKTWE